MKTLVLGLGNPIQGDDAVGLHVAERLRSVVDNPFVTISDTSVGGMELVILLSGYNKVILVDAIQTKDGEVGDIYHLNDGAFRSTRHIFTTHEIDFTTALQLGKKLGLSLPEEICAYAIEVFDVNTFSEVCTEKVRQAIPEVVEKVLKELNNAIPNTAN